MKLRCCMLCLLSVFLVIASLDSIPDPPAVSHDGTSVKAFPALERASNFDTRLLDWNPLRGCSRLGLRFLAFTTGYEPGLPAESIVLTAYASDPSPPA